MSKATHLLVIGTSLNVYPASGLLHQAPYRCEKYLIDPDELQVKQVFKLTHLREKAGIAVPRLVDDLLMKYAGV